MVYVLAVRSRVDAGAVVATEIVVLGRDFILGLWCGAAALCRLGSVMCWH